MAFTTESYWNILVAHLVRRNQRSESDEVSESIQAHGSATGGGCMALFIIFRLFFASKLLQGFRERGKMALARLGQTDGGNVIHTWRFYLVDVYHQRRKAWDDLLRGVLGGILCPEFPHLPSSFLDPMATCDPWLGVVVFFLFLFYISFSSNLRLRRRRFGFSGIYHVNLFFRAAFPRF